MIIQIFSYIVQHMWSKKGIFAVKYLEKSQ